MTRICRKTAVGAVAGAVFVLLLTFPLGCSSKDNAIVPDLSNTSRDEARELVEAAGLVFRVSDEYSAQVSKDKVDREARRIGADVISTQIQALVKSQRPAAGTRVAIGTPVEVVICNEEQVILMSPNEDTPATVVTPDE